MQKGTCVKFFSTLLMLAVFVAAPAYAQDDGAVGVAGNTYVCFIYSDAGLNINADMTFDAGGRNLYISGFGGIGSYFELGGLVFIASYKALDVALGGGGDMQMLMSGINFGATIIGVGVIKIGDVEQYNFYFTGTLV